MSYKSSVFLFFDQNSFETLMRDMRLMAIINI